MRKFLSIIIALFLSVSMYAEVIDLGAMELNKDYVLQDFKGYKGSFTAPKSGVLTCSSTNTDDMTAYSDANCAKACSVTKNGMYGPHSYDLNIVEGTTYYFYIDFVMNACTFKLTMADNLELTLTDASPALNTAYSVSGSGQVSFDFNKAVAFTSASIKIGDTASQKLSGQVSNSSIFFNDVQGKVWSCMTSGTVKEGDDITISITGVCMASNKAILYNGDGNFEAHYKVCRMPAILVSTEHTSGNFLSYYRVGDDAGIVKLHFSEKITTDRMGVQIKYGDVDKEAEGDYYIEHLEPTLSDDQQTLIINLQGKRRKASDMVASSTLYQNIALGITGVTDTHGEYAYSDGQGSIGSYWFLYNFQEVSANISAEFSPVSGSDLTEKTKNIEIWIADEAKLSYDGILFTYPNGAWRSEVEVPNTQIKKEVDPDDASARILTLAVPSELIGKQNIELSFKNLQCADGSDYSNLLRARYNAFVITRTNPVAGSTLEKFTAGQEIRIYTNRDAMYDTLQVSLVKIDDLSTLFEGIAVKENGTKGFVYTCKDNRWLAKGSDYKLVVSGISGESLSTSDQVIYHGAAVKIEDLFYYGYLATGITLQDTLVAGNIKTATISGFSNAKHTGNHYALLNMPEAVSNTMDGCQITHIGFYPFITSKTTATIVISHEVGGTPIYEQEVSGIQSQQWTNVELATPFTIQKDEPLYIGYVIESATGDYPVGYYYTSNPAAQAVVDPIIDWIAYDDNGTIKSGMLDAQMYAARRQTANLMLYATIEAPLGELPANAVAVGTTKLSNGMYLHPNADQTLTCYYTNTGIKDLESFDVTIKDGETVLARQTVTPTTAIAPMWESSFSMKVPTAAEGLHQLRVTIDNPNGETNLYTGSKTAEQNFLVYTDSVRRNVLLEHFTTGQCVNCVKGEELVESELAQVPEEINVIRINHHSGYGTDKLTIDDDVAYEWFYGETYVWAPANMIDRTDLAAYGAKGYGGTNTLGPVFGTDKSASISSLITSASNIPSFIEMEVEASVDDNRELTVKVHAEQLYPMPQAELMRLNVAIVQDSVKAAQKLSDSSVDKNFIHYNVLRANVTGTWGEKPEFVDNKLDKTFSYTVPAAWNVEKLRVVAFLANYDETSTKNCSLYNAAQTQVKSSSTGIGTITAERNNHRCFNLMGQPVSKQKQGMILLNGKKYINK